MKKNLLQSALVSALFALSAQGAFAQGFTAGAAVKLENYSYSDETVTGIKSVRLVAIPFAAAAPLTSWAQLTFAGAYAMGTATAADDSESEVSGLTDTSIGVSLGNDRVRILAAYVLPTGKTEYTSEEAQVAGLFAADLFPFSVTNWGGGGAVDVSAAVTMPLGAANLGVRLGYQAGQEFDLLQGQASAYRPGNQLYGRVAIDGSVGNGRLAAEVTFYQFSEDEFNSQNLFQSGDRIQAIASYGFAMGRRSSGALYGGVLQRQHGAFLNGTGETASQTLLLGGAGVRRPMGKAVFAPSLDVRVLSKSDGVAQGYIGGAGATIELPMGTGATFLPSARLRFGSLKQSEGVDTGITGFEVGAGVRFGGAGR